MVARGKKWEKTLKNNKVSSGKGRWVRKKNKYKWCISLGMLERKQ